MKRLDMHVHAMLARQLPLDRGHLARLLTWARRSGLDGIALTEHFHAAGFWEAHDLLATWFPCRHGVYLVAEDFRVVAGAELSLREGGHILLLGDLDSMHRLDVAFSRPLSEGFRPAFRQLLEQAEELDLLMIGAHVFRRGKDLQRLPESLLARLTALEVNGKDSESGIDRVATAARELGLAVVGGSDAHHWIQVGARHSLFPIPDITLAEMRRALASRATWHAALPFARLRVRAAKQARRWLKRVGGRGIPVSPPPRPAAAPSR